MTTVTIHEAKTHLSRYLKDLEDKKTDGIIIKKYNRPVGKIILCDIPKPMEKRKPGMLKGQIWISEKFDEPLDEFFGPLFPEE